MFGVWCCYSTTNLFLIADSTNHSLAGHLLHLTAEVRVNLLLALVVVLLILALPAWPYSGAWGYYPSGGLGVLLVVVLLLVLSRRRV